MVERNYVTEERQEKERLLELKSIEHPDHYTFGRQEVIETLIDWFPDDPIMWQVGKYISRAKHKGKELQDLKKAKFYLDRKIKSLEKQ